VLFFLSCWLVYLLITFITSVDKAIDHMQFINVSPYLVGALRGDDIRLYVCLSVCRHQVDHVHTNVVIFKNYIPN